MTVWYSLPETSLNFTSLYGLHLMSFRNNFTTSRFPEKNSHFPKYDRLKFEFSDNF